MLAALRERVEGAWQRWEAAGGEAGAGGGIGVSPEAYKGMSEEEVRAWGVSACACPYLCTGWGLGCVLVCSDCSWSQPRHGSWLLRMHRAPAGTSHALAASASSPPLTTTAAILTTPPQPFTTPACYS